MATKHDEKPNVPVDASAGWEKRDVNIKGLFIFAFWMAVVLFVTLVGMYFTFNAYKKAQPLGPTMSPMVKEDYRYPTPKPLLQVHPHQELQDYCDAQQKEVTTYGWVDQPSGVVRVPVDRAEELILAKGLPARSASDAAAADAPMVAPATVAGDADVQGQCGYLTEPTLADKERAEAEQREAEEKRK
jgi:hypothetical protein